MVAIGPLEEYCPSCGEWVSYLNFDHKSGWCHQCVGLNDDHARCTRCGTVLPANHGRSTCHACRQERWLEKYMDELEYLVVAKGYSVHGARMAIIQMVRPICRACNKPIKGGREGALFHKSNENKSCHAAYARYVRLRKSGLTEAQALDRIQVRTRRTTTGGTGTLGRDPKGVSGSGHSPPTFQGR